MKFDLPKDQSSIIKVVGVGGGGSNAVNHMYRQGIKGVDFIICNTDRQALDISPVPHKVQLGSSLTEGRGAGSIPEVGKNAAIEDIEDIRTFLEKNSKMVFITAGMGGGTGTGAAPVIAQVAKEMGILTVGIVTIPFAFEGTRRRSQAEQGIEEMRQNVDTLLIICNDRLREMYGNLTIANAFEQADNILATAAKGIAEVITVTGSINVDFEDVRTVMSDSGVAIMGSATAEGEERAVKAIEQALASPLLNDNNIRGAEHILLNITYGKNEITMDELTEITDFIQEETGLSDNNVIWGHGYDEALEERLSITLIATGFNSNPDTGMKTANQPKKKVIKLEEDVPTTLTQPIKETTPEKVVNTEHKVVPEKDEKTKSKEKENIVEEPYLKEVKKESPQRTIEFDINSAKKEEDKFKQSVEPYLKPTTTDIKENNSFQSTETNKIEQKNTNEVSREELQQKAKERIARLKEINLRLKTPSGISELENEPAYKRREIKLDTVAHSSESQVSRYTLSEEEEEEGEKKIQLKENNSFLHDNVD